MVSPTLEKWPSAPPTHDAPIRVRVQCAIRRGLSGIEETQASAVAAEFHYGTVATLLPASNDDSLLRRVRSRPVFDHRDAQGVN
jgi:hypothetical protein